MVTNAFLVQSTFGLIVNLAQFIGMSAQQNIDWPEELDPVRSPRSRFVHAQPCSWLTTSGLQFFELFSFANFNMCVHARV